MSLCTDDDADSFESAQVEAAQTKNERISEKRGRGRSQKVRGGNAEYCFSGNPKKCLAAYGYARFSEEDEAYDSNAYTYGFKNKNDDICKLEVRITDSAPMYLDEDYTFGTAFSLDYVSAHYREEEKIANELIRQSSRYKHW